MRMLIDAGANPFYKDNYQQTVMFYVCREGTGLQSLQATKNVLTC